MASTAGELQHGRKITDFQHFIMLTSQELASTLIDTFNTQIQ